MKVYFEEPIDLREYGIFNGKPTIFNRNREERRQYIKEHKKDKYAKLCPHCDSKTNQITDDNSKYFCELCGRLIEER